ncbi:MAG TPA: acyl-CoA desaturase [Microthrixaceae bacterium]|nr:acyl-CoA desaturase [Microthrixaceae bacterium]
MTTLIVVGPPLALIAGVAAFWGDLIGARDVVIGATLYAITALGVTVGYHRLFTHRAFTANRPLKVALAAAGSMAVEGSVIGWVAIHRRHHRFSDRSGDPHSPHGDGGMLRGLAHAHVGWLFTADPPDEQAFAADLQADRDLRWIARRWGWFAIGGLVLPLGLGWMLSGTVTGALRTFLWAGLVRMMLLHHITWSVNSICHTLGRRPFPTRDQSRNVAWLSVLSLGESFHNLHHAYPQSARHGALPHQVDGGATAIRLFERLGWATQVCWPDPQRLIALRNRPATRSGTKRHTQHRGGPAASKTGGEGAYDPLPASVAFDTTASVAVRGGAVLKVPERAEGVSGV